MKKLAFSDSTNTVYVAMSPQEFKSVTKVGQTTVAAKATELVTSIKAVL